MYPQELILKNQIEDIRYYLNIYFEVGLLKERAQLLKEWTQKYLVPNIPLNIHQIVNILDLKFNPDVSHLTPVLIKQAINRIETRESIMRILKQASSQNLLVETFLMLHAFNLSERGDVSHLK